MAIGYRISAECPVCDAPLLVRYRRADQQPFLGCSGYPGCTFVGNYDRAFTESLRTLTEENTALTQEIRALKAVAPHGASLAAALKRLLFVCHPDRWNNNPVAEELTKEILAFRQQITS